jgi:DNA-binding Lrp family transcriptional regulator
MKTVMLLGEEASELLFDSLNQRMVERLVFSEYSVAELARKLSISPLKAWRRLQKLVNARVVEVVRVERRQNLEKKVYRATAARYIPKQLLDLEPKDERLSKVFNTYLELQKQMLSDMSAFSDVPEGSNPVDYAIYTSLKSFCKLFRVPALKEKIRRLERELSEFEEHQVLPSVAR